MLGQEVLADNLTEKQQPSGTTRNTYDSVNQPTKIEYPAYTELLYCIAGDGDDYVMFRVKKNRAENGAYKFIISKIQENELICINGKIVKNIAEHPHHNKKCINLKNLEQR